MKIGILTFHNCINYGSFWQTYCLVKGLQQQGHEVNILNHQSKRVNTAEWKCALEPTLPTLVPKADFPLYEIKIRNFIKAIQTLPLSRPFSLENPVQIDEYDLVVAGSDEIWNLSHPWYGYYPLFFGEGIRTSHLVSYAASFGSYHPEWKPDQNWIDKLRNFDMISVRDKNSQQIIRNILGIEPEIVLDPCLQFPFVPIDESRTEKPYAAIYGHNFSESLVQKVQLWANENNLPLISIGYRNDWADEQWLNAGPYEFAAFMYQAEVVITNFYHGCIFAFMNYKPFVTEISPYRSYKIQDLLEQLGATQHIVREDNDQEYIHNLLRKPLEKTIYDQIAALRETSNFYLEEIFVKTAV